MEKQSVRLSENEKAAEAGEKDNAQLRMSLEKILQQRENWIEVEDIEVSPGCPPGENFVSDVHKIVIYGRRQCLGVWTDFRKTFIVKKIPEENSIRHAFHNCCRLFENEITAYEKVLPFCQNYVSDKWRSETTELCFPRYYGQCQTFLLIQDLHAEGYQLINRLKGFNKKECSAILQELSKFHAISFALKKNRRDSFSKVVSQLQETIYREEFIGNTMGVIWENSLKLARRSLNESMDEKLRHVSGKLELNVGKVLETLIDLTKSGPGKFSVICHGDLWNNNILLRYCESGYPMSVKFIDLQAMRYSSCVLDVMHLLFTSSRLVVHKCHLEFLLKEYYDSLLKNLRNFGEHPEFSMEEFREEFKSKIYFGIFVACLMFTCITRKSAPSSDEPVDCSANTLASETYLETVYKSLNSVYHERLRTLFSALVNHNFI